MTLIGTLTLASRTAVCQLINEEIQNQESPKLARDGASLFHTEAPKSNTLPALTISEPNQALALAAPIPSTTSASPQTLDISNMIQKQPLEPGSKQVARPLEPIKRRIIRVKRIWDMAERHR